MSEWWEAIDRDQEIEAARHLVPHGGLLVVQGTDTFGRLELLNRLEAFFADFGLSTHRLGSALRPLSVKDLFLQLWKSVAPGPYSGLPPWTTGANLPIETIVERVAAALSVAGNPCVLIEDPDRDQALPPALARCWVDLADACGAPVVLSSLPHTDWSSLSGVLEYCESPGH